MDSKAFRAVFIRKFKEAPRRNMAALAREAGVSYNVVRDLVRRPEATTSIEHARALARVLGFSADTLEDVDENPEARALREQLMDLARRLPVGRHPEAVRFLQGMVLVAEQEEKAHRSPPVDPEAEGGE